ncbi:hypothetical protein B296_00033594 [Ensete ventricosum]|uniref:Uncharacterized protein n=1 Tax=Ensete ventricosum TaxID=4639 RepID=A0A427A0D7_ENSVE|nr:hypothetical protein B296_00033594 [Ensete ventricosum]
MYWCARCSISGRVAGGRSINDQKKLDGLSPVKNAWMARDGWRSDFVIGLTSGSGKLRGLRQPEAMAALPRAGPSGLGPLVTPFAGVPPGEPIVGTATAASSVGRGWCSAPEFPNGRSCNMGPPSSAKILEPNLVPAQWVQSAPVVAGGNCWFRPLCASSPVVVSGRSRCSARWMDPSYPVTGVGCWSGGVRIRRRHLRSLYSGCCRSSVLATLLPLWLTMPSYPYTTPAVLALYIGRRDVRRWGRQEKRSEEPVTRAEERWRGDRSIGACSQEAKRSSLDRAIR